MSRAAPPWRRLFVLALLLAGSWAALTLRLDTELLSLLPPELPSVRALADFQRYFASEREVIVIADPAMPEEERAAAFHALRPRLAALPGVETVTGAGEELAQSWPEIAAWALWNLPPERFTRAVTALAPDQVQARLAQVPAALGGALDPVEAAQLQLDPLGLLEAVTGGALTDGANASEAPQMAALLAGEAPPFLIVRAAEPLAGFEKCIAFTAPIREALRQTLPGDERLLLTGRPVFTAEISQQMRGDMALMMGAAALLVCGVFWLFYRTLRPLGWILFFQFLALLAGTIVARVFFGSLNVISMGFASILLGVSMDYSILVYHHFASPERANAAVWARLRRGIWFSAATTAAAFAVLMFSSFPGLRQLAALVAVGLLASALFATWLLRGVLAARPPSAPPRLDHISRRAGGLVERIRRPLLIGAGLVAISAAVLAWQMPERFYTAKMSQFQPAESAAWRGQQWLLQQQASEQDALYLVRTESWAGLREASQRIAAQVSEGRESPWSHLLPDPAHQAANRGAWPTGAAARLRAEFERAGFGEEWSGPTLTLAKALDRAAAGDEAAFAAVRPLLATFASERDGRFVGLLRAPGAAEHPLPAGGLEAGAAEVLPVSWVALGEQLTTVAQRDVRRLGGWMLAALALLCALAQRSWRLVALNFAALLLALLTLAVLLVVTGARLSPLSLLSVPLLLGLVIDYSLHVLMALEHNGGDVPATYGHLAAPIVLTGLSSCIGFGAPILTNQPALRNFGFVMDLGIFAAVATCLLILPALHRGTRRRCPVQS